jgi:tetratricopeptide (TPR) repeat protein
LTKCSEHISGMGKRKRKKGPRSRPSGGDRDDGLGKPEKMATSTVRADMNSSSPSPGVGRRKAFGWLYVLGLAFCCLLVWHQTLNVPFHFDDIHVVEKDLSIRKLESCYKYFEGFFNRGLLMIGYTLNYAIAKKLPDGRPLPKRFHVVNLLLHLINTLLAFELARLVIRGAYGTTGGSFAAFAVALVFAVLPIHTMGVNLIASRAVVQSATFSLLFLILGILFLDTVRPVPQRIGLAAGAVVALLCSVASKAVGIAAVGLFSIIAYVIARRKSKLSFGRRQLLYLGIIMVSSGALLVGLIASGAVWQTHFHGVWANLLTQAGVTLRYLKLMVWPMGISIEHNAPVVHKFWDPGVILSVAVVLGLLVVGCWLVLRGNLLGLCILWYFVALAPSSSVIPRMETMLEYRAYLAALGFAGALVWLLHQLQAWLRAAWQDSGRWATVSVLIPGVAWMIVVSFVTLRQNQIYTDPVSLWTDAVKKAPQNARSYFGLAFALDEKGRLKEAISSYSKGLGINPDNKRAHYDLARALVRQGKVEEGISHYYEALRIKPDFVEAHYNLAGALMEQERFEEAIGHYRKALEIKPDHVKAHINLGIALERQGRLKEAIEQYLEALRIAPNLADAHYNLGNALMRQGNTDKAIGHYYKTLRINPDYLGAHYNLGIALAMKGDRTSAAYHFTEVLRIDPGNLRARQALELLSQ